MKSLDALGLVAATFTPFTPEGQVEISKIPAYAEFLEKRGVQHVFVNGATGESLSLSLKERKELAEAWIKCRPHSIRTVMVHVGCNSLPEAQELAQHSQFIGADAIAVMAPCCFKPSTPEELVDFCRRVAEAAPEIPFLFYHLPSLTGVDLDMIKFAKVAMEKIPSFCGIKFSTLDLTTSCILQSMTNEGQRMRLFYGADQQLLSALVMGIDSAIGSTYNIFPEIYQRMVTKFQDKDIQGAQQDMLKIQEIVRAMFTYGYGVPACKSLMNLFGFQVGPVRSPLYDLSVEARDQMKRDMDQLGFQ